MKLKSYLVAWSIILISSMLFSNEIKRDVNSSRDIQIIIPKVVKSPEVIKLSIKNSDSNVSQSRAIKFSKRYPPNYTPLKDEIAKMSKESSNSTAKVGYINHGRISVNLIGDLIKRKDAKAKLIKAGFEIVKVYHINKRRSLVSIVFTNDTLKKMASKSGRGFAGTLRLLIDKKDKIIAITNPLYITKAFLQDDFNKKESEKLLSMITKEFKGLKDSLDKFKFQGLPKYQFMEGMPHYKDMIEVGNGDDLLEKVKNNKKVAFVLNLDKDSTLVGVKLSKRTKKFPKKIGLKNAGLLPYPVLIENNRAMILDPKYYISVMYPDLKMEEFMTIATIPEAIEKDCNKVFR